MMPSRPFAIHALLLVMALLHPQTVRGQEDSSVLTLSSYLHSIKTYHPLWIRAELHREISSAMMLRARGNFDPEVDVTWRNKFLESTPYYRAFQSKVKIPVWYNLDVIAGYDNITGTYVNPELQTQGQGLWSAGAEVQLGQGLIWNERRAALEQARIARGLNQLDRDIQINDLLAKAAEAYLAWQVAEEKKRIIEENTTLAFQFYLNTRQLYFQGDKPAMDTLEAFLMWQDQGVKLEAAVADWQVARQSVEAYIWLDNIPLELTTDAKPQPLIMAENWQDILIRDDARLQDLPQIDRMKRMVESLRVDRKLKMEKRKPYLSLSYTPLLTTTETDLAPVYQASNYKWGFTFGMPILFREARADIQLLDIKRREIELSIANQTNQLRTALEAYRQSIVQLDKQIRLMSENVEMASTLYEAERIRFMAGESSVFLLNRRQETLLDWQLKQTDLTGQFNRTFFQYLRMSNAIEDYFFF